MTSQGYPPSADRHPAAAGPRAAADGQPEDEGALLSRPETTRAPGQLLAAAYFVLHAPLCLLGCLFCAASRTQVKETQDAAALQERVMAELRKSAKAAHKRADGLAELVEVVKRQRDQFKDQTRGCLQQESEMQDKLRLINAELDVLRSQSLQKDALLVKAHKENSRTVAARDKVRTELGRTTATFWLKQSTVEEQLVEIEALNLVINAAEKDMLVIRKRYEAQVEQRNWAGLVRPSHPLCHIRSHCPCETERAFLTRYILTPPLPRRPSSTATTSCASCTRSRTCTRR